MKIKMPIDHWKIGLKNINHLESKIRYQIL